MTPFAVCSRPRSGIASAWLLGFSMSKVKSAEKRYMLVSVRSIRACANCGDVIEPGDIGRPPAYCGEFCRREAEYAIRRANSLIMRAEKKLSDLQAAKAVAVANGSWSGVGDAKLKHWADEIESRRAEVSRLLGSTQ